MKPKLLEGQLIGWEALKWTPDYIGMKLEEMEFRMGLMNLKNEILWENQCKRQKLKGKFIAKFMKRLDKQKYFNQIPFMYFGYKDMSQTFGNDLIRESFSWKALGLTGDQTKDTTFWLGSKGSYTPCHYDTYGFNVIAQIYGQCKLKLWIMFPPEDLPFLYPTRVPYEESSVFSLVNPFSPNLIEYPYFQNCHPHVAILSPGQALYLPHHWWHYVISLSESTISINTWVPMNMDKEERVKEATVRCLIHSIMDQVDPEGSHWINSNIDPMDHEENMQFLNMAIKMASDRNSCDDSSVFQMNGSRDVDSLGDLDSYQKYLNRIKIDNFGFDIENHEIYEDEELIKEYGPIRGSRTDTPYLSSVALVNSMVTDPRVIELTIENYKTSLNNQSRHL